MGPGVVWTVVALVSSEVVEILLAVDTPSSVVGGTLAVISEVALTSPSVDEALTGVCSASSVGDGTSAVDVWIPIVDPASSVELSMVDGVDSASLVDPISSVAVENSLLAIDGTPPVVVSMSSVIDWMPKSFWVPT